MTTLTLAQAQERWDNMLPRDDDGPYPTEAHIEEAFSTLVRDSELLADFIEYEQPDYTTPFQLFHEHGGLPRMDGSARDDALRDKWQTAMDGFFSHYRDWLGERLDEKAQQIMLAEMQAAKDEAAESRFDDREYERNFG